MVPSTRARRGNHLPAYAAVTAALVLLRQPLLVQLLVRGLGVVLRLHVAERPAHGDERVEVVVAVVLGLVKAVATA